MSESGVTTPAGGTAVEERPAEDALLQTPWTTIVWDDPVNLMSYVTHVFATYFGYPRNKAHKLMLQVHLEGKAAVSNGTREEMERDVTAMHEYGLWATLEKSDRQPVKKFRRRGRMITTRFNEYEVTLLASLIDQLIEVVAEGEPEELVEEPPPADPFEAWDRELAEVGPAPAEPAGEEPDPVLDRLFPDAYPDDANASADFRRFTQRELRSKKVTEARFVLERLVETQGGSHDIAIPLDEVDIWLRTLTSLRLAVAIRLGITDAAGADELAGLDDSDPRAFMASVYDWLGFAEETLVSALS